MKWDLSKILLFVGLGMLIGGLSLGVTSCNSTPVGFVTSGYEGKILIHDQQEDAAFKEALADPDVTIDEFREINTSYPKLVEFRIEIYKPSKTNTQLPFPFGKNTFNYPHKQPGTPYSKPMTGGFIAFGIGIVLLIISYIESD